MASARNIRENRIRESSFNKIPKESSFQKLTIEKEKTPKPANDHLRLIIDGLNAYSKEEIFAEMLKILKKPQPERNHLDIKFLIFATTNIKFFQKTAMEMGRRAYEKICNFIEYGHYSSGETIFNLGDRGDKFYVILKGRVGVFIKITKEETNKVEANQLPSLCEVATLNVGDGFGELALLNSGLRLATIICKEDCYFATLNKENFKAILAENEKEKIMNKIDFLLSVPAFSKLRPNTISTLIYHFNSREFHKDIVVYKEGDDPRMVYIIKNGEFKISKIANITTTSSMRDSLNQNSNSIQSAIKRKIDIALLGPKEIFGEEEIIFNLKKRNYTITCSSLIGEVLVITKDDFYKRIISTNQEGLDIMEEIIKRKKILHEQLFSQNETFRQKKILQKEKNPFSTFSSIFTPTSFLSQNISRIRSSLYKRTSQKIGDITQRISNHNENNNFFLLKKTLLNNKRSSSCHLRNNSNLENMMINSKEKQIKPNLVSYLEFLDKKWKEMKKVKSEKIEEEIRKKQIGDFFSERKNYKLVAHKNQTQTQKQKIEKDISYLNLNCKQIFKKLMEVKRNELEIRNFKPNFEYSTTRKTKSFHKVNPKNFNFYEEDLSKRDELMETFLSIKKLK